MEHHAVKRLAKIALGFSLFTLIGTGPSWAAEVNCTDFDLLTKAIEGRRMIAQIQEDGKTLRRYLAFSQNHPVCAGQRVPGIADLGEDYGKLRGETLQADFPAIVQGVTMPNGSYVLVTFGEIQPPPPENPSDLRTSTTTKKAPY